MTPCLRRISFLAQMCQGFVAGLSRKNGNVPLGVCVGIINGYSDSLISGGGHCDVCADAVEVEGKRWEEVRQWWVGRGRRATERKVKFRPTVSMISDLGTCVKCSEPEVPNLDAMTHLGRNCIEASNPATSPYPKLQLR